MTGSRHRPEHFIQIISARAGTAVSPILPDVETEAKLSSCVLLTAEFPCLLSQGAPPGCHLGNAGKPDAALSC